MKTLIAALFLSAVVLAATPVLGQEKYEVITVQNVEVHIRYVIATVQGQMTALNCNAKRMSGIATHCSPGPMSWSGSPKTRDPMCTQT